MKKSVTEKKKDIATRLDEVAQDFLEFISTEFMDCSSYFEDEVRENVIGLLKGKPKVMVYGIYNSGKSTLINALCRGEVAETANRPKTSRITEYDKGDYYLIDSPGVDAPIEHERVTDEYLEKCHIILFVISSKGEFESKSNYKKLAAIIKKGMPFIIVLNDRGYDNKPSWNKQQREKAKFDHDNDIDMIRNKIIKNLIEVSNDKKIADQYEVVVLNAKKGWEGIAKSKQHLYDKSNVDFLNQRINQLVSSNEKYSCTLKQPISNLKECLNKAEELVAKNMSGNDAEDFTLKLQTLRVKKDNIMDELKLLIKQKVQDHLGELTDAYVMRTDNFEATANLIFDEVDDTYKAKMNELLVYVERRLPDLKLNLDTESNLLFDTTGMKGSELSEMEDDELDPAPYRREKKDWFDFMKTRKMREKEKEERLQREADYQNQQAKYKVEKKISERQDARQLADCDLRKLREELCNVVEQGLEEKYNDLVDQIQQIVTLNEQSKKNSERQMKRIRGFRQRISGIENSLN